MKEVVVLSLIVAVVATGFGQVIDFNNNDTTAHSSSSSEATTEESSITSLTSHTTGVTASSTHAHETTSFTSPTTTSPPKPQDVYAVYENKSYCIIIKANISIAVNYISAATNKTESCIVYVPPPSNVTTNGSCTANDQWIAINFNRDWILTLRFEQLNGKYFQSNLSLDWNLETSCAKRPESGQIDNNTHLFETSIGYGYVCSARKVLYSNASAVNDIGAIYTEKLQLEAFQSKHKATFSDKSERCSEDTISNLVPIIVGACLGGLIIIVLIAYLIGRKRSRRGYESV